ncbi:hypothetical protein GA0115258_11631, partial [Streptomyces sp. LamerLS-31b]
GAYQVVINKNRIFRGGCPSRVRGPAICGCAVWTSGGVPVGLMMLGGKSRKPQRQG